MGSAVRWCIWGSGCAEGRRALRCSELRLGRAEMGVGVGCPVLFVLFLPFVSGPFFHSTYVSFCELGTRRAESTSGWQASKARLFCWFRHGAPLYHMFVLLGRLYHPLLCLSQPTATACFYLFWLRRVSFSSCFWFIYPGLVPWRAHPGPVHGGRYVLFCFSTLCRFYVVQLRYPYHPYHTLHLTCYLLPEACLFLNSSLLSPMATPTAGKRL